MGTYTVRTTAEDDKEIKDVQEKLGEKTASRAFLMAIKKHQPLIEELDETKEELRKTQLELRELKWALSQYVSSQKALFDIANK